MRQKLVIVAEHRCACGVLLPISKTELRSSVTTCPACGSRYRIAPAMLSDLVDTKGEKGGKY